jgi:HipA-like protein
MTRKANVFNNKTLAGVLERTDSKEYFFAYTDAYFTDESRPPISLSFPKTQQQYSSKTLFPFFYGLLSEGVNKETQCRLLRIDENDSFSLLLSTAQEDTIGAITVKEINS